MPLRLPACAAICPRQGGAAHPWRNRALGSAAAVLLLVACRPSPGTESSPERPRPALPDAATASTREAHADPLAATFDRVVTAEILFPDAAQRALYRVVPPELHEGKRVYGFELKPQPGMQPRRHFHIVSITIGNATGVHDAGPSTLAGPNGAFNEFSVRTGDDRYELSVSEGNLLPDTVELPPFELTRTARAISERYAALRDQP